MTRTNRITVRTMRQGQTTTTMGRTVVKASIVKVAAATAIKAIVVKAAFPRMGLYMVALTLWKS
jgi:hypothetical protein